MNIREIKETYDAVIVGGGPAGSMTALKLAKSGKNVLLIERGKMPRNKTCTGMIDSDSFSIINREIGGFPMSLCVWPYEYKGFKYKMAKGVPEINIRVQPEKACYSINRSEFDQWLTMEASMRGATVIDECSFAGIVELAEDHVIIKVLQTLHDGKRSYKTVRAEYLIAADGMDSFLRKILFPEREIVKKSFCRQEYYLGDFDLNPEFLYYFRYNTAVDDPIWIFKKDQYVCVGSVAYPANILKEKHDKIIKYFVEQHGLKINEYKFTEVCCESVNFTVTKMKNGKLDFVYGCANAPVLFVGEAGEMVDSMNNGIWVALDSGCYAADAICKYENKSNKNSLLDIYKDLSKPMIRRITDNWNLFFNRFGRYF